MSAYFFISFLQFLFFHFPVTIDASVDLLTTTLLPVIRTPPRRPMLLQPTTKLRPNITRRHPTTQLLTPLQLTVTQRPVITLLKLQNTTRLPATTENKKLKYISRV